MLKTPPFTTSFLLVEDDQVITFATKKLLEMKLVDVAIDCAGTGELAKDYIRNKAYDFILLDLGLPDMHGSELAVYAKTNDNSRCLTSSIVVLSAHQMIENHDHEAFKHVECCISKPLTTQWIDRLFGAAMLRHTAV